MESNKVREAPHRKNNDAVFPMKVPDQGAASSLFGRFGGTHQRVIAPPHVIQMTDVNGGRDRSGHHPRGGNAPAIDSSGGSGNGYPREHRKCPRPELQLESSKRLPPNDKQKQLSPPPASLFPSGIVPSQGVVLHSKGDDGHDSSGFISMHRRSPSSKRSKKHPLAEPLSGLKHSDQLPREEHSAFNMGNMKQPETSALGLIPNFNLGNLQNVQPISPGVVDSRQLQPQQHHLKEVAVAVSGAAATGTSQKQLQNKGGVFVPSTQAAGISHHHLSTMESNKKSIQRQVPSPTPERSSKQMPTVGEMMQTIGSSTSGSHVSLHHNPMLQSISQRRSPGNHIEQDHKVREAPHHKNNDAVFPMKVPDQGVASSLFGQFGSTHQGVIAPLHIIQMTDVSGGRDRSSHHSRGESSFQNAIDSSGSSGNGHPREHKKRPRSEVQLESSKRLPPNDKQKQLSPPPASLFPSGTVPSKGFILHPKGDDGHDSSGSDRIISMYRCSPRLKRSKKYPLAEPQSGLKRSDQLLREENSAFNMGNMKQPETPALGPTPNFSLGNLQPISPGVVDSLPAGHLQPQQHHLKEVAVAVSGAAATGTSHKQLQNKGGVFVPSSQAAGISYHHLSTMESNKKSIQRQVPSPTPERSSKQMPTVGEMMQTIGSSTSGSHVSLHHNPMLQSIGGGGGPGKHVERDHEVRKASRHKSDDTVLPTKVPDQAAAGSLFGQFGSVHQEVIAPPHVIQMMDVSGGRDRSGHHPRGGSAFQSTIDSSGGSGNGHPREHRKRPRSELQLESSKRLPPNDEQKLLRPPPASLFPSGKVPSKGVVQPLNFMTSFMPEGDEAKNSKLKEQFPGFDYDPSLPIPLNYQLLAYQNESQKRQEKAARMNSKRSRKYLHQPVPQCSDRDDSMENKHIKATLQAMERKGTLKHNAIHGAFVGPARSGKNSLMENLLGQSPDLKSPSTGVAESVVQVQVEKLSIVAATVNGSKWSRIDYNDEVIRLMKIHRDPRNVEYEPKAELKPSVLWTSNPQVEPTALEILTKAIETKGLNALEKHFETSWSLYLSNTGGQMEFQEILPLLVSGPCIFFYTFRLDRNLDEQYVIEYELPDGVKSDSYKSTLTIMGGILHSLAGIAAMGIFVYRGSQKQKVYLRPKVFFIGTHRDRLPPALAESIIADKDRYLQETMRHFGDIIEFSSESRMIFAVDNFSQDKSEFQNIRSAVERVVERHEFEMVCPSHWLIYSLALRRFKDEIVSYEECFKIARECGIDDKEELNEALHFIHTKMGLIRYYPYEGIKDLVVIQPQFLYDKITELIVNTFTFEKAGKQLADEFQQKGIFSVSDFEKICRKSSNVLMKASQFAMLLEKLHIAAPFERDGDSVTKYFLPCVVTHAAEANTQIESHASEIPPLIINFKCGYCPKGLGGALISYLMANEMNSNFQWNLLPNCIFRDQVSFEVGPLDTVVLKILPTHLIVTCIPDSEFVREDCSIDVICAEVRKAVEEGIRRVASDINLLASEIQHSFTFLCSCHKYPAEMKMFVGKPYCLCCNKTRARIQLPQGYDKWYPIPHGRLVKVLLDINKRTVTRLTENHLSVLTRHLTQHAHHWIQIGLQLGFRKSELDNIKHMPLSLVDAPNSWLTEMLSKWFQWAPEDSRGSTSYATLEALTDALHTVNLTLAANDIRHSFFSDIS